MNCDEEILLALINCSIHNNMVANEEGIDWDAVKAEADIQTVTALAAKALPPEQRKPWRTAEYVQLASYTRYMVAQDELCRLFAEAAIPTVILKGTAASLYYPQPSLRAMGDIDIITQPENYDAACELLRKNGYTLKGDDNGRHYEYVKNGIEIEMHHHFSHENKEIEAYIINGLSEVRSGSIDGHSFPMLPRLANGIVLLDHMRSHLRTGVGLRQLIDWMMYVDHELDDDYWREEFGAAAEKEHLETLAITAARCCQKYLGLKETLTWCKDADDNVCDVLMESLMYSGNFGRKTGTGNSFEKVGVAIKRTGFLKNLQIAGEHNWRALRKYPRLKAFAWLYQIFRYSRQILEARRGKNVVADLKRSKDRLAMLEKLGIN